MYSYEWDNQTGGYLLNSTPLTFSKEPRPVYYKELDILGFDRFWNYAKNDTYPYMWAEANNYFYRGRLVATTKGGSVYTAPDLVLVEAPEPDGLPLRFVDIPAMVEKNQGIMEKLSQDTIKRIYNTFVEYQNKVSVFYVAFSGGKDSIVALDLVQRALPHNKFKVMFGDTGMEFPDTYHIINDTKKFCEEQGIEFLWAKSNLSTESTWKSFGPPAVTIRWCCSVHKTSPQITLLQEITGNQSFTGMAFTGIRGDESVSRSEYDDVCYGEKHKGQFSCHPIIEWNSAELFAYIFQNNLLLNDAYRKGNSRVGCLMCPLSSGKHEFMKHQCYPNEMEVFVERIKETNSKTGFTDSELKQFIDDGNWKTRKTGRELTIGNDKHIVETDKGNTYITVFHPNERWKEWAKTIGDFIQIDEDKFTIEYHKKKYEVLTQKVQSGTEFLLSNCGTTKDDIKFISLFRGIIVKSVYCVSCGVCAANCPTGCIDMNNGLTISDKCCHCYQCNDIYEHCLRYNSIRNRIGGERKMKGMDRYFSFGIRKIWLDIFFRYEGSAEFWNTDGDNLVANKKKDAFLNFIKDAGLVVYNKSNGGDKYTKYEPSELAHKLFRLGPNSESTWGTLLCNLVYTSEFNWFIKNIKPNETCTTDKMKYMLEDVMEGDTKGLGKRNVVDAFKMFLIKTPLGSEIGLGHCDYDEKISVNGTETITLTSFYRDSWENPDPKVILYSLYKFAEACGNYYQFSLTRLLNHSIDSNGVSPTEIFGLDRNKMERILNGLSFSFPEFIDASFALGLDNITLRPDKKSDDVLKLF